jgi:putative hemolysin
MMRRDMRGAVNLSAPGIRLALSLAALLGLGACSSPQKPMPDPQCRAAAYADPAVKAWRERNAGIAGVGLGREDYDQQAYLQNDAYAHCMQLRGLAPPGGVEAVRRPR